jgi:glycine cleavage system H protein
MRGDPVAYPTNYRYTKEHEWISVKGDTATIGITDYAQHELGDVVFAEVPKVGTKIEAGKTFGNVESVKAVSDIYAPVSGEVTEANGLLKDTPEKINSDPHGEGWLIKIKLANPADVNSLMDAAAYEAFIASQAKEASA